MQPTITAGRRLRYSFICKKHLMSSKVVELNPHCLWCRPGVGISWWESFGKCLKAGFFLGSAWFIQATGSCCCSQTFSIYPSLLVPMAAFSTPALKGPLAPCKMTSLSKRQKSDWSFSAGGSLGALACHCFHQYCSETTQGYPRMFRGGVVNALGLLGLHLMPGPCWVAIPGPGRLQRWRRSSAAAFPCAWCITSLGSTTMQNLGNTGERPLPLETLQQNTLIQASLVFFLVEDSPKEFTLLTSA